MATFYLLPPRATLERAVADLFGKLLPGLPLPSELWDDCAARLADAGWPADVFLIPKDELPDGDTASALVCGYGAEPGDRVVEVSAARSARAWVVPDDVSAAAAAR
jgi:hypothetical protein